MKPQTVRRVASRIQVVVLLALINTTGAFAQANSPLAPEIGSLHDAWGIRIGAGIRGGDPNVKPVFNPYLEVPLFGQTTFSVEAVTALINFATLDVTKPGNPALDAYGFAGKLRWYYGSESALKPNASAGVQLCVYPDRVAFGVPLSYGYAWKASETMELETALTLTPLIYLGRGLGSFVSLSFGFRIPHYQ